MKGFTKEKVERNILMMKELAKGKSFRDVAMMFGLGSKLTVYDIYRRALVSGKYGVRDLSTGIFAKVRKK